MHIPEEEMKLYIPSKQGFESFNIVQLLKFPDADKYIIIPPPS